MDHYAFLLLSMSLQDAKAILGFPPEENPSPSEVMKAWREKAFENHPDRGGDPKKMVEINVAKDILEGKQRPTYDRSGPGSEASPGGYGRPGGGVRWTPPPPEVVTFEEAKSRAGIPSGVEWQFVTGTQRGTSYSSDEFSRSDNYWVAYGKTGSKHVFVGMRYYTHQDLFVGGRADEDKWTMASLEIPIKGDEGTEPAWLYGGVVKALKMVDFKGKFNSKVVDARGWKFDDKRPTGSEISIKHWLAESGLVSGDDPRVQSRKHVIELHYRKSYNEAPDHYKIQYDYEGFDVNVNGKPYPLNERDVKLLVTKRITAMVFGTYYYGGETKNLTRSKNGKKLLEWMAKNLTSLPTTAVETLLAASAQMK
jgi:hypothetical protein